MSGLYKSFVLFSIVSSFLLLGACGNDDAEMNSMPAAESAAPASSEEGMATSMDSMEKAEGVVYQDEIYANWPYTETE